MADSNANYSDENADDGRPEGKKEQQAGTYRIGIWIRPQPNRGCDDDEEKGRRADDE